MREEIKIKKIGDVCEVIPGQSPKSKFYNDEGDGLPFYQGKKRFTEKFLDTPVKWTTNITKEAVDGDLLMSVRAPVGPVNFATQKICIGRGLAAIRPKEKVDQDYLFYFFLKNEADLESTSGAVFDSINSKQIREIKIPIPPLPEQKRIVAMLDEAFEAIDQARANIERNIENAEELFQSKLNEIFSQRGEGWEEESLKNISKIMYGYTDKSSSEFKGPKYLRITDIQDNSVNWDNVPNCHPMEDEYEKYQLHYGDIVFARTGATTGKSYLIVDPPKSVFASYLIRVQADHELLKPDFLFWYFQSPKYWQIINEGISGSAQGGFNATKLGKLRIPIPPTETQDQIVEEINSLYEAFDTLKSSYQKKLRDIEELKKSILQKAFSGELTANEHVAV